ncbi:hypothetical protein Dimus_026867, partial [Dionaea muscipula]
MPLEDICHVESLEPKSTNSLRLGLGPYTLAPRALHPLLLGSCTVALRCPCAIENTNYHITLYLNVFICLCSNHFKNNGNNASNSGGAAGVKKPDDDYEDEIVESDVELDNTELMEPDNDPPQKMGDPTLEVSEMDQDAAQAYKSEAILALTEGKLDEAIDHLTRAIMLNPHSAILYATRANVFLKLKKPNAAIRDANAAIQINSDSAKGYKVRGIARALLGQWEAAANDLHVASKLDFDEEIGVALKKVEPNAHKIEEHHRKYERLRNERYLKRIQLERQRHRPAQEQDLKSALNDGLKLPSVIFCCIKKLITKSSVSMLLTLYKELGRGSEGTKGEAGRDAGEGRDVVSGGGEV